MKKPMARHKVTRKTKGGKTVTYYRGRGAATTPIKKGDVPNKKGAIAELKTLSETIAENDWGGDVEDIKKYYKNMEIPLHKSLSPERQQQHLALTRKEAEFSRKYKGMHISVKEDKVDYKKHLNEVRKFYSSKDVQKALKGIPAFRKTNFVS